MLDRVDTLSVVVRAGNRAGESLGVSVGKILRDLAPRCGADGVRLQRSVLTRPGRRSSSPVAICIFPALFVVELARWSSPGTHAPRRLMVT